MFYVAGKSETRVLLFIVSTGIRPARVTVLTQRNFDVQSRLTYNLRINYKACNNQLY